MYNTPKAYLLRILPLFVACVALLAIWQGKDNSDRRFSMPQGHAASSEPASFESHFASHHTGRFVHAASVTELNDGRLFSVWFGGSREGAKDVNIYGAWYDPKSHLWSPEVKVTSPAITQAAVQRTIRKVGNPVVSQAPDGKLWLFYVTVSVGGWAGSAINASYSLDGGSSWSVPKRLITTPFFNISTLVKGTPLYYDDGSIALPVYHEFLGKFSEVLHLSANGEVLDKSRITHGKHSLQPVIVPASELEATALMRNAGNKPRMLLASQSLDGGKHWQGEYNLGVPNPNSALTALRLENGDLIAVMNALDDGRHLISLMHSSDEGESWQQLKLLDGHPEIGPNYAPRDSYIPMLSTDFAESAGDSRRYLWAEFSSKLDKRVCKGEQCRFIYDYPFMIRAQDGYFHLVYTWNKSFIKHLRFNQAWLEEQTEAAQ